MRHNLNIHPLLTFHKHDPRKYMYMYMYIYV